MVALGQVANVKGGKDKVKADKDAGIKSAIQAGKKQELVPTIKEFAATEATAEFDHLTKFRIPHWTSVIQAYQHDVNELKDYPKQVRHAFAAKLGVNLGQKRKQWSPEKMKFYDIFVANNVSPISTLIEACLNPEIGCGKILDLLKGPGTMPEKMIQAKIMLGRPVTPRGTKDNGGTQGTNHGVQKTEAELKADKEAGKEQPKIGNKSWDLADLTKKTPLEAVQVLIGGTLRAVECIQVIQAIALRFSKSDDQLEKDMSERLTKAIAAYDAAANPVPEKKQAAVNE